MTYPFFLDSSPTLTYLKDDDLPREGELREQDRFLPIFNISKVGGNVTSCYGS
jgi:hypothetical protein